MANFLNCLISQICGDFQVVFFCTEQLQCSCRIVLGMFLTFLSFDPNWLFNKRYSLAWATDFTRWPIFKIVSILEYFFFRAAFCTEQLLCSCRMVLEMFLAFLIFDINLPFCKGYSFWKMADFQYCLISRIFGAFFLRFSCTEQL